MNDLKNAQTERLSMATRVARDIPEGWNVNLGIGIPTMIADLVPQEREVIFQSENGILAFGPAPKKGEEDFWLVNAGKQHITLRAGGAYFSQAESFAMIRGGHLDLCVLGAYEVTANGDLANWSTAQEGMAPAVGGAMDLAAGAKRVWVVMEHTTRQGEPRILNQLKLPATARGVVSRIYTNLCTIDVQPTGLEVVELVDGITFTDVKRLTATPLRQRS